MIYKDEIIKAMEFLAKDERVIFLGQNILYSGSFMSSSFKRVPDSKKIELPLIEDMQMGMSIGLSLEGFIPVSVYPRMDFLILAMNQLVNHLDKIEEMSMGEFKPMVIIRTAVGATKPLYPGLQHCSDYSEGMKYMLKNVNIVELLHAEEILPSYRCALERNDGISTLIIEKADLYFTGGGEKYD